jgi:hypothetical protein
MKIPAFIQSLLIRLIGVCNLSVHAALEAVRNVNISDALQQAAHDGVIAAENSGGDGSAKFNAAVEAVKKDFAGVAIGAIHTAVQNAWAALYGAAKPAPAPAPAPAAS